MQNEWSVSRPVLHFLLIDQSLPCMSMLVLYIMTASLYRPSQESPCYFLYNWPVLNDPLSSVIHAIISMTKMKMTPVYNDHITRHINVIDLNTVPCMASLAHRLEPALMTYTIEMGTVGFLNHCWVKWFVITPYRTLNKLEGFTLYLPLHPYPTEYGGCSYHK